MRRFPPTVPYGADQTIYLVLEAEPDAIVKVERTDFETIIADLLSGQFRDPVEVIAFNTLEHWSEDLSRDVAREIQCRCDIEGHKVPDYLEDFVGSRVG